MVREGSTVLITDRNRDRGTQAVSELQVDGGTVRYIESNLKRSGLRERARPPRRRRRHPGQQCRQLPTVFTVDHDVATFEEMFDTNHHRTLRNGNSGVSYPILHRTLLEGGRWRQRLRPQGNALRPIRLLLNGRGKSRECYLGAPAVRGVSVFWSRTSLRQEPRI